MSNAADNAFKTCTCCGLAFTKAEFEAQPLPDNGVEFACGMQWRNCGACGGTITVEIEETEAA